MKAPATATLSARVPLEVLATCDKLASAQGLNRSQWLTNVVATQNTSALVLESGGSIQTRAIPKEIQDMLTAGGVAVVGIGAYSIVGNMLEKAVDENGKPKFTDGEVTFISVMVGVAIAMGGYGLFKKLTE